MNDKELLYIKTIAETRNISEAAKKLFIAQPSLSQALKKIEDVLGTELFIRTHNGMKLTFSGEKYYAAAVKILNIYDDFKNDVIYVNDLKRGRINIGITSYLGTHILPKILPKYTNIYPDIEVYISEDNSENLEKMLLDSSIELALMHYHPYKSNESLNYELLNKDPFLLVTKKDHPLKIYAKTHDDYPYPFIDIRLFKEEKFILLENKKRIRDVSEHIFYEAGFYPKDSLIIKSCETARRLASIGFGVTFVPLEYIEIFKGQYEADYYFMHGIKNDFWHTCVTFNKNMYISKASKAFIEKLHEFYK